MITVDWGNGAGFPYSQAAANTRLVGAEVGQLIRLLRDHSGVSTSAIHIIGHSLGAHVAGYAGSLVQGLGRITGMHAVTCSSLSHRWKLIAVYRDNHNGTNVQPVYHRINYDQLCLLPAKVKVLLAICHRANGCRSPIVSWAQHLKGVAQFCPFAAF